MANSLSECLRCWMCMQRWAFPVDTVFVFSSLEMVHFHFSRVNLAFEIVWTIAYAPMLVDYCD